ncbi:MAG: hypothetical protein M0T83_01005 [Nitrospiraceae bacterium]|jgi:hypothetical protein|uniref:hypothetical protein n=1 Tax=Leptospirillum ferriphilum TaxID=178606 RepID=UPI0016518D93|nr:hypothetical protein [Leptospirillum ferriphilum]MDA8111017.1 hypothetical protein [Nitrospiraceae bacterium]
MSDAPKWIPIRKSGGSRSRNRVAPVQEIGWLPSRKSGGSRPGNRVAPVQEIGWLPFE